MSQILQDLQALTLILSQLQFASDLVKALKIQLVSFRAHY
jgi:hypothetical protein